MNRLTHAAVPLALLALLLTSPLAVARLGPKDGKQTQFVCSDGTVIYARCTEKKEKDGVQLCMGDTFKGKDKIYTPRDGYSPCEHTPCLGLYCEDANDIFTLLVQSYVSKDSTSYNEYPDADSALPCNCFNKKSGANGANCTPDGLSCPGKMRVSDKSPLYPQEDASCAKDFTCPVPADQLLVRRDDKCDCCSDASPFSKELWKCSIEPLARLTTTTTAPPTADSVRLPSLMPSLAAVLFVALAGAALL